MPFFPVDDDFAFHAKARAAGNAAIGLWARAGAYCMKELTDGILLRHELEGLGKPAEARRLVEVRLWHGHGHDCDACPQPPKGGWVFHEWADHGPIKSSHQIREYRAAASERQRRKRDKDRANAGSHAVTYGEGHAETSLSPSPSPSPSSVVQVVSQSPTTTRAIDGLTDEDLEKIRRRLGSSESHAAGVAIQILSRAQARVINPLRYVLAAIDQDVDDYKPTPGPPTKADCCPEPGHGSYPATGCGACRSETIAGGDR